MKSRMKKVFLDDLPKWGNTGYGHEGSIKWSESIGYKVKGTFNDLEFEIEILGYDGMYLSIKYLDKKPFKIKPSNFIYCKLAKLLDFKTNEFKIKIGGTFKDDKRDITIIAMEHRLEGIELKIANHKYYQYKCNICGWSDDRSWMIEGSLLAGNGCSCCYNRTTVVGINSVVDTDSWMIPYFQGGYDEAKQYTHQSSRKITPICTECGHIKDKPMTICDINKRRTICCNKCGDGLSYPNKIMFSTLEQLGIDFEAEFAPAWCVYIMDNGYKKGRYDFYFEKDNVKYIIEMDGKFHTNDNKMNGRTKEESLVIDEYKQKIAGEHNIKVIRIECEISEIEYIKHRILDSVLNDLFDLVNINWVKIQEFALSTLVKMACDYKKENIDLTTTDIGKIMKLSAITIGKYLKRGAKLGWCNYDIKEELEKSHKRQAARNKKNISKAVEIFKDNLSLGIFESCVELERQSKNLFGVKLTNQGVSAVSNGKIKTYKGYTCKFINNKS